jgi:hypothetical protein
MRTITQTGKRKRQMSEMVERVARAIAKARHPGLTWPTKSDPEYIQTVHTYLRDARAAIEAMREPTEEMIKASNREWDGRMSHRSSGAWQVMIDAALKETTDV